MMIENRQKWLLIGAALILFALLKVAMLLWWQSRQTQHPTITETCSITQSGCLFGQGANLQLIGVGDHKTPFTIRATGVPAQTQQITASFSMKDMDMGFNRFVLNKQANGSWLASNVHLPLCTQSRHDWLIDWQMDNQHFQAAFQTKH